MCLTLNSAAEWAGSMFQVEVVVAGGHGGLLLSLIWMQERDIRCNKYLAGSLPGGRNGSLMRSLMLGNRLSMSDFAQSVKQQADIVKVIESYIRLRKAGAQRFTGLCPFHKEKTPSLQRARGAAVLLLLRLPGYGRCVQLCGQD